VRLFTILALTATAGSCDRAADSDRGRAAAMAEAFLADQRAGAWSAAFSRLHSRAQHLCGDGNSLRVVVTDIDVQPDSWELREPRAGEHSATVTGALTTTSSRHTIVEMSLDKVDGDWRIWDWAVGGRSICQ
jgi:hypothetical protein